MITTVWDGGVTCRTCGDPVGLGQEMLYGDCLPCGRRRARDRSGAPDSPEDVLAIARAAVAVPGRIVLTRRQLRALVALAREADPSFSPVRRPSRLPQTRWYARMPGWDAARVAAGLTAQEAAGLWLDFLAAGRVPPLRHADIEAVLSVIDASVAA